MARAKGRFNFVAMLLAFGAMAGFLYWLSTTATPTEVAVVEEETAQAVSIGLFAGNPAMYEGDLVALDGVVVGSVLGSQVFLAAFPDSALYPIRLDPSLGAGGAQLSAGASGRVTGVVQMMTDSIVEAWAAQSVFADDAQREAAAASATFLLAREVDFPTGQQDPPGGGGA
jgi:hypothetical protein